MKIEILKPEGNWTAFMRHLRDTRQKGHAAVTVHPDGSGSIITYNAAGRQSGYVSVMREDWAPLRDALVAAIPKTETGS